MKFFVFIALVLFLHQGLVAQEFFDVIDVESSPKGDIRLLCDRNDYPFGMDVWLINREDTTQTFRLDSAITLGTNYFFSPDENWIAANFEIVSNARTILLYKRIEGIRYSRIDSADIYERADTFCATTEHLEHVPLFGHREVQIIRWLPDSKSFVMKLDGWDDRGLSASDWTCIFNVESLSVSVDKNNQGKVVQVPWQPIPRTKKKKR